MGNTAGDLDKATRTYITDAGYRRYFTHEAFHGIGLEVEEATARSRSPRPLRPRRAAEIECVDRDRKRLDKRPRGIVDRLRRRVEAASRPSDPSAERAIRPTVADEAQAEAQVGSAGPTGLAAEARDRRVDRQEPTAKATGLDHPGELVAEDQRSLELDIAGPAVDEPMPVGAAQAHRGDPHERASLGSGVGACSSWIRSSPPGWSRSASTGQGRCFGSGVPWP